MHEAGGADWRGAAAPTRVEEPLRQGLFMISCAARTGSSMLVNMLQTHPAIACHMEIFNPQRVEGFWGVYRERLQAEEGLEERIRALRARDPAAYIYKIAFDPQGRRCVGFKFKYEEFLLPAFAGARTAITSDTDVKIVHLRRRNLLKRYLSHVRAMRSGVTMRRKGEPETSREPVTLDPQQCLSDFQDVQRREQFVAQMLRQHPSIEVAYEDMVGEGGEQTLAKLLTFLGVEARPLRTAHEKLADDDLEREISNYAELKRAFADGPYAAFFEIRQ